MRDFKSKKNIKEKQLNVNTSKEIKVLFKRNPFLKDIEEIKGEVSILADGEKLKEESLETGDEYFKKEVSVYQLHQCMKEKKKIYHLKKSGTVHISVCSEDFFSYNHHFKVAPHIKVIMKLYEKSERKKSVLLSFLSFEVGQGAELVILGSYLNSQGEVQQYIKGDLDRESCLKYHITSGGEKNFIAELTFRLSQGAQLKGSHIGVSKKRFVSQLKNYAYHDDEKSTSDQIFREIAENNSFASVQTRVIIDNKAQESESNQDCKVLLMGEKAKGEALPELEVYADNVKCSHGATLGSLEKTTKNYIQSRGIDEKTVQKILLRSFVGEALSDIEDVSWVEGVQNQIFENNFNGE